MNNVPNIHYLIFLKHNILLSDIPTLVVNFVTKILYTFFYLTLKYKT